MAENSLDSESCSFLTSYGNNFLRKSKMLINQVKWQPFPSVVKNAHFLSQMAKISLEYENCSFLTSYGNNFPRKLKSSFSSEITTISLAGEKI